MAGMGDRFPAPGRRVLVDTRLTDNGLGTG